MYLTLLVDIKCSITRELLALAPAGNGHEYIRTRGKWVFNEYGLGFDTSITRGVVPRTELNK